MLSICNYFIKIVLVPAESSRRTTFWTTLSFRGKTGSIFSFDEIRGSSCPSQVVLSDSTMNLQLAYHRIDCRISTGQCLIILKAFVSSDECNICDPNEAKNLTYIAISSFKRDANVGF